MSFPHLPEISKFELLLFPRVDHGDHVRYRVMLLSNCCFPLHVRCISTCSRTNNNLIFVISQFEMHRFLKENYYWFKSSGISFSATLTLAKQAIWCPQPCDCQNLILPRPQAYSFPPFFQTANNVPGQKKDSMEFESQYVYQLRIRTPYAELVNVSTFEFHRVVFLAWFRRTFWPRAFF